MCQFIESIQILDGEVKNLSYHQARVNRTFDHYFQEYDTIKLASEIKRVSFPRKGKHKLRIVYSKTITDIQIDRYRTPKISKLKLVEVDFAYDYKYENRQALSDAMRKRGECDDILMVKNGFVTDTYFCNVAFRKNKKWYTPSKAMLYGTKRAELIDHGLLEEVNIMVENMRDYSHISLFNALNDLGDIEIPVSMIL